jgi:MFS family permease
VAAVNLANFLPVLLFVLFAGLLADSKDRKHIIIVTFAVLCASATVLAVSSTLKAMTLPLIMITTFVAGTAYTFSAPAGVSFLPTLVPKEDMLNALALSNAQYNIGRVIGPAIGTIIISAWSVSAAFYINAVSFLFVICAVLIVKPRAKQQTRPVTRPFARIGEGIRYVFQSRWRPTILLSLGLATFVGFSTTVLYPSLAKSVLGGGSWTYGLLMSFLGVGAVVGAPLVTRLNRTVPESSILKWSALGIGAFLVGLSCSRLTWLSCLLSAGIGCCYLAMCSAVNSCNQARSPLGMRGRMVSMYSLMFLGMFSVGGQFIGFLADAWSVPPVFLYSGVFCVLISLFLFAFPGLTRDARSTLGIEEIARPLAEQTA